jgi:hypothetical protein
VTFESSGRLTSMLRSGVGLGSTFAGSLRCRSPVAFVATDGGGPESSRDGTEMSDVKMWLFVGAIGLAGYGLAQRGSHAHDEEHHHHTHEHSHGGATHTHYHSHDADDGHVPEPGDGGVPRPCGGDDHHCCMDHGQPDGVVLTVPPRESRRPSNLDTASTPVAILTTAHIHAVALTPPRAPPRTSSSQDSLPHLRTIVLLT